MATIEKRQREKESVSYHVKVRLKGFPTQFATFKRLTDAKRWAQETETNLRDGRFFKTSEAKKHTLAEAIVRYLDYITATSTRLLALNNYFEWWKNKIGSCTLIDVTPALITEYRDKLRKEKLPDNKTRASSTINHYMSALSHLFTIAMKEWGWVEDNPFRKISKLKEPRGRVRFLSDEEREKLLIACKENPNPYLYIAVILCLSTGARKMEIMSLTWDDVDFNRGVITLHQTKNGERRLLPLTGKAFELLKEHAKVRHISTKLVFPSLCQKKPAYIRFAWQAALKAAGIPDFRFHDLRHSAASYLAMNNASLAEIAEVLGHKTLQMVKRYAHLSEAHTAKVVASMNQKIFG